MSVFLLLCLLFFSPLPWEALTKLKKPSKLGNRLREGKTHQTLQSSFTFSFNFPWPVALCTESIFLTPFPIYYQEKAGREGRYWLTECSLCLHTKCTLHKNGNEIAVCFLCLCLYFKWKINNDGVIWLRCDSQYESMSLSRQHILFCRALPCVVTKEMLLLNCRQVK